MRELAEIQRRFYAIVTGATPIESAGSLFESGHARIEIYRRMYRDRLVDTLADDYPKLAALLGPSWLPLVDEYLHACPPAHPDIRQAGCRLADYLAWRGMTWKADLARLEWARSDVFFAADAVPLTRDDLTAVDPVEFPGLRFAAVPAHELVAIATNADDVWSAIEDGAEAPAPSSAARTVMVWRRGATTVVHRTLDADEAVCLARVAGGARFEDVCDVLAGAPDPAARAIELLLSWLDAELLARGQPGV